MKPLKVLVCGGRNYGNEKQLFKVLDRILQKFYEKGGTGDFRLIQGEAKGADYLAKKWAQERNITTEDYPADWKQHGKIAGIIRNREMLKEGKPNLVVAFPGGRGTANMVDISRKAGIKVIEVKDEH